MTNTSTRSNAARAAAVSRRLRDSGLNTFGDIINVTGTPLGLAEITVSTVVKSRLERVSDAVGEILRENGYRYMTAELPAELAATTTSFIVTGRN